MKITVQEKKRRFTIWGTLICVTILCLGYFSDPPNGYTGAPGDDLCTECHSLNMGLQNGSIILNGLPPTIIATQTYVLTVTVTNPNELAEFAGFQTVVLDDADENAGTFSNPSNGSQIETTGGRTYHEHDEAEMFGMSNAVSWTVDWEAPIGSGLITFYGAGNIANGTGTDNGDLIVTTSISGILFTPLMVAINNINHVSCFGADDGSLTASASFGEPPYTYAWSNGGSGATISGLAPGDYTVTVSDGEGDEATATAEITEPSLFEIMSETIDHVTCNGGNDGMIILVLDGGTPPYTGAQGDLYTLANLQAGDYSVTITDANDCEIVGEYTINEPPALSIEITIILEPDCGGDENGLITVEGSGGNGDIEYEWSNGESTSTIQNLSAGTYTVTITDENGCTATETIDLEEPDPLEIDLILLTNVSCAGEADGEIIVDASGGTGDVSYEWSDGSSSSSIDDLEGGEYTVTVTDENGCTSVDSYEILEPPVLSGSITGTLSLNCFGDANGTLQVQGVGGAPGYTYLWSNGSTNQTLNNLGAGTYTVTVTDDNACIATSSRLITQPPQLLPNATSTNESAPGEMDGSATSAPTGGTGSYTFVWSNGETTATITGLGVGSYTVTVTDNNGCTATQTVAVSGVNCTLSTEVTTTDALCFGEPSGSAEVEVSGSMGDFDVLWSNGDTTASVDDLAAGSYSVMVNDDAGCVAVTNVTIGEPDALTSICVVTGETMEGGNDGTITCTPSGGTEPYHFAWSNGDTTGTITGLSPGTYFLTITDANDCTYSDTATVNGFNCALLINLSVENAVCFGESSGSASVIVVGGTEPYTITWSTGSTETTLDSVPPGNYSITVSDADGCVSEMPFEVGPDEMLVTVDTVIHEVGAIPGSIQVTITGGTPPYTTVWTRNGGLVSTEEDPTGLIAGDYILEIIDANDCVITTTAITVLFQSGLEEELAFNSISIWPNPASQFLLLRAENNPGVLQGAIYSAEGKFVRKLTAAELRFNGDSRIDVQDLATGLYYIHLSASLRQRVIPFVKL